MDKVLKESAIALERWKILRNVILKKNQSNVHKPDSNSVRIHNSFSLFDVKEVSLLNNMDAASVWHRYTWTGEKSESLLVKSNISPLSIEDVTEFDNTGNVCIWASEEVMAYYCLSNRKIFENKSVCELGGGNTSLAGQFVCKYANPSRVVLSDGNRKAILNLVEIVEKNFPIEDEDVKPNVQQIRWDDESSFDNILGQFDFILCSDCLFKDKYRQSLAQTIFKILKIDGEALIFAPSRGRTLNYFLSHCNVIFGEENVSVQYRYNDTVWDLHAVKQKTSFYNEDIHYPQLISLKKTCNIYTASLK